MLAMKKVLLPIEKAEFAHRNPGVPLMRSGSIVTQCLVRFGGLGYGKGRTVPGQTDDIAVTPCVN
jgi:hypothetical protein